MEKISLKPITSFTHEGLNSYNLFEFVTNEISDRDKFKILFRDDRFCHRDNLVINFSKN